MFSLIERILKGLSHGRGHWCMLHRPEGLSRNSVWKLIRGRFHLEIRKNFLMLRTVNQCNSLPPRTEGAPSFNKRLSTIYMRFYKDSCLGQGVGLEGLQGPFQLYDSVIRMIQAIYFPVKLFRSKCWTLKDIRDIKRLMVSNLSAGEGSWEYHAQPKKIINESLNKSRQCFHSRPWTSHKVRKGGIKGPTVRLIDSSHDDDLKDLVVNRSSWRKSTYLVSKNWYWIDHT